MKRVGVACGGGGGCDRGGVLMEKVIGDAAEPWKAGNPGGTVVTVDMHSLDRDTKPWTCTHWIVSIWPEIDSAHAILDPV